MQAAHPKVAQGALDHSGFTEDPFGRVSRTIQGMAVLIFGTTHEANAMARHINRLHDTVQGTLPESIGRYTAGETWATFLTDAFSRRLLAVYLTFDEPSYRTCMMTLRECVHRHNRLPELVVVDWGPEFESIYFETLLARYECSKATRPQARPRFGSIIERLFNTANTTFVHNLAGNTQVMKNVRQVTKSVDPRGHALWTLGELYGQLRRWAYEEYETTEHETLSQTPREAFEQGLLRGGMRPHRLIPYDEDFLLSTLPTTPKGTAQLVAGRGVKINKLFYWARGDAFRDHPELEKTQLPIRYDPYDMGHAYVFLKHRWVECISEHYTRFKGHSERELQMAAEELRQRTHRHSQQFSVTAAKLAEFVACYEEWRAGRSFTCCNLSRIGQVCERSFCLGNLYMRRADSRRESLSIGSPACGRKFDDPAMAMWTKRSPTGDARESCCRSQR